MIFKKTGEWFDKNLFNLLKILFPLLFSVWTIWVGIWFTKKIDNYLDVNAEEISSKILFWLLDSTTLITIILVLCIIVIMYKDNAANNLNQKEIETLKFLNSNLTAERNELEDKIKTVSSSLEDSQENTYYQVIAHQNFINDCICRFLRHISSDHLSLDHNDRLSLYLHRGNEFVLAGRYSQNLDLNKSNRNFFPDNQGCIGISWQTGNTIYSKQNGRYETWQRNQNIASDVLEEIRMKSQLYCAIPIYNNSDREGILLAESLQNQSFTQKNIELVVSTHGAYLVDLLQEMKRISGLIQSMQEA